MKDQTRVFERLACLTLALVSLSAYGAPLTPDGSTSTTLDVAPNGVPVVNIAAPNAAGLSHNRFTDYNVDATGLILNNANTTTVDTQLGGFIFGNAQLSNSASLILNEVSSTNRTHLNGFTEIAGQRADLVIANPNGLTINGAGFINTNRVTLTTGQPVISNGALSTLNITRGDIAIQGAGLNMLEQNSAAIYTQYLNLNAQLHAQNLDIRLGGNSIDYLTGTATSNNAVNTRMVLLDASALGGMYANRIMLVGTDRGLGVNLPAEVLASSGDIRIDNDGVIVLQKINAGGAINVTSRGAAITVNDSLYADTSLTLNADTSIGVNTGAIVSGDTAVTISAVNLRNHGSIQSADRLNIIAANTLNNSNARIIALGDAVVQANTFDNSNATLETGGSLSLTTPTALLVNSTISAGVNLLFTLDAMNLGAGSSLSAGGDLGVDAANSLVNDGDLLAGGNLNLQAGGVLINNQTISAEGSLQLDASRLDNNGVISGGSGASRISVARNISNSARISAVGDLDISSGATVVNSGFFNAGNDLTITAANLTNQQTLFAGNDMNLHITDTLLNNPLANIFAMNNLTMAGNAGLGKAREIINYRASIETYLGDINIYATSFTNKTDEPVVVGTYVAAAPAEPVIECFVGGPIKCGVGSYMNCFLRGARLFCAGAPATPERIDKGEQYFVETTIEYCAGHNCKDATTTTVDRMVLQSESTSATLNAGRNLSLNAGNISNQYSLISAGSAIYLAAQVVDNQPVNITEVTTVRIKKYRDKDSCRSWFGKCGDTRHQEKLVGTETATSNRIVDAIASTIQAGGSIIGNVANLSNSNIQQNQTTATPIVQTQNTATTTVTGVLPTIILPEGDTGLFIASPDPQGQYLIETNPAFTVRNNLISSDYLLSRIGYDPSQTYRLLGDALYENRLIRDAIFAQTGRRFLRSDITSDAAQYQTLMDNALTAQEDLLLMPGIALTATQVAALNSDIVWLVEQEVAGQTVLAPVVYIADTSEIKIEGGKIIAGRDINLAVATLDNSGLLQAGNNLTLVAANRVSNQSGSIRADGDIALIAENNIENISATIQGNNARLVSNNGDIINRRYTETQGYSSVDTLDIKTVVGTAGEIVAGNALTLQANGAIGITGSTLRGGIVTLAAQDVTIGTTVMESDFSARGGDASIKQQSTTNLASSIEGGNITLTAASTATIVGSTVSAEQNLNISAAQIDVLAVNDSRYVEEASSSSSFLSSESKTTRVATSTNLGSNLSGGNVSLRSSEGDISIIGSAIRADKQLALDGAGNINLQAGYDGAMNETIKKKSGFFSGGSLYSSSTDVEGELSKTAVLTELSGQNIVLNAAQDMTLAGVAINATQSLDGRAQNITVANATDEITTWSKYEEVSIGIGDSLNVLTNPGDVISFENGKASLTVATASISQADETTITRTVVSSSLAAGNINLTAASDTADGGNIKIVGTDLYAENDISLNVDNNVSIEAAKNTEQSTTNTMEGSAEISLTVRNEYVQIAYAVEAVAESRKNLEQSKKAYRDYQQNLDQQRDNLTQLQADFAAQANGEAREGPLGYIEQADINELASLIDELKSDDAFYKANITLAAADLASKTLAVVSQTAAAAQSSGTYGFSTAVELDIRAQQNQSDTYREQSVASTLMASNISINAGSRASARGSDLAAREQLAIRATDIDILATQDVSNNRSSSANSRITVSLSTAGGVSGSASADRMNSDSRSINNRNSQFSANNIVLESAQATTIIGANVIAADTLAIDAQNLTVASVQDRYSSRSDSQGVSTSGSQNSGISGVGGSASISRVSSRDTVLTTLTGNRVDINVAENTTLTGALIAAVDKVNGEAREGALGYENGNDNGQLRLSTDTLTVGSLNNTNTARATSAGLNIGIANQPQRDQANNSSASSVGIDFSNTNSNSRTKTLGTLGSGNIQIANLDDSDTILLNRDTNNTEIDIYNVQSSQTLQGTVDTRVFSEDGRNSIAEDFERVERLGQAIGDVISEETFTLQDTFVHINEVQKDLDVQKAFALANDGQGIETLQGDTSSVEEKQAAIDLYAQIYADVYGINIDEANIVAAQEIIGGTTYANADGTRSNIAINDNAQNNAVDYASSLGHEVTHARIRQGATRDRGSDALNDQYADSMGGYSAGGLQFSSATYNNIALDANATSNTRVRSESDLALLDSNNRDWRADLQSARQGNGNIDYLLPQSVKDWRDNLNQAMDANRQSSAELQGDALGTALSMLAAPADVVVDLANVLISSVDLATDSLGSTGILGQELQAEAVQNLKDLGVEIENIYDSREAIAVALIETLEAYPERIAELDPSALRSLVAIVGETALPAVAIARTGGMRELMSVKYILHGSDGSVVNNAFNNTTNIIQGVVPQFTYRGTIQDLEKAFPEGFREQGESKDLFSHALDNTDPPSIYVPTSKSLEVAIDFATEHSRREGNLYIIRPSKDAIDVNKALGSSSPHKNEHEVAVPYGIRPQDVRAVIPLNSDGTFKINYSILNPNWSP